MEVPEVGRDDKSFNLPPSPSKLLISTHSTMILESSVHFGRHVYSEVLNKKLLWNKKQDSYCKISGSQEKEEEEEKLGDRFSTLIQSVLETGGQQFRGKAMRKNIGRNKKCSWKDRNGTETTASGCH